MSPRPRKETQLTLPSATPATRTQNPATGTSWEVRTRAPKCSATGIAFAEGDEVLSRLVEAPEGMVREDYRRDAWTKELRENALFHWKTRFRKPQPRKEPPFKEENAEEFLRGLLERNDPAVTNTVFILAVMLERKRILVERGVQRDADGHRVRIYEHKEDGETFFIVDPELTLGQISEVQQEVALQLGWIQPPAPQAEAAREEAGSGPENEQPPLAFRAC